MELVQLKQVKWEKQKMTAAGAMELQDDRQRGVVELARCGEKNVPWALHPPVREVDGGGISSTAGSRRRWGDKDNDSNQEFPSVTGIVSGSSGKPERLADRVKQAEHCSCGSYDARYNRDYYHLCNIFLLLSRRERNRNGRRLSWRERNNNRRRVYQTL